MAIVRPISLTGLGRLRRAALAGVAGGATGAVAIHLRPYCDKGVHWEAVVAIFVVLPAICLWLVLSQRRVPWRRAMRWLVIEMTLVCVCFTAAWSFGFGRLWDDFVQIMAVFWAIAAVAGGVLLIAWQQFRRPVAGPYCPGCGYCLIGLPSDRCPECGREFTLEELGVGREALRPGIG